MSDATPYLREDGDGCVLSVRVTPRASRDEIRGVAQGRLLIRLRALPAEGAANAALEAFLAGALGLPKSRVAVIRGGGSREKLVRAVCPASQAASRLEGTAPSLKRTSQP